MRKLRVSSKLALHCCPKDDVAAYIRAGLDFHKKAGFDAADFPMDLVALMGDRWEDGITDAVQAAQERGLRFELCHLPYGVKIGGTPEEVAPFNESVHRAIDAARLMGVDYAVVHPNTTTVPLDTFDRQAHYDSVMEHLSPFAEHAAKVGLNIVVENMRPVPQSYPYHRYCADPEELCTIADALGIGVCWDFGHAHINGLKQSEALAYVGSRLKMLHVNDNFAYEDEHIAPFFGTIDWADAMQGLTAVGFNGLLNYEVAAQRQPAVTREAFAKYLIDAAQQLCELL